MEKAQSTTETTDIISVDNLKSAITQNNFVDLDETLINSIHQEIDEIKQTQSINEEAAKGIIAQWHKKNLFRAKKFNVANLHLEVSNEQTIYIQAQYHCETREFKTYHEPYDNQAISNKDEELWGKPAQNKFTSSVIKWRRLGNNKKENCFNCKAKGYVRCDECGGEGTKWIPCPNCKGRGQIEVTETIIGRGGGKTAAGVVLRHEQCLRCNATGQVQIHCPKCNGSGKLTCGTCHGNKELFYYDQIEGNTSVISKDLILSTFSTINDKWIKDDKKDFQIQYEGKIIKQNEDRLKNKIPKDGKLLLEKYNIKILPTTKINFNYNNKKRELFIIHNDVFANETGYIYDRRKTSMAIGVGVIIIILLSVFARNWYSHYQAIKHKEHNQTALNICNNTKQILLNGNIKEAGQKLLSLELDTNYDQATKDSINSTVQEFLMTALNDKITNTIDAVYAKFSHTQLISDENKRTLSDFNTILAATDYLHLLELNRQIHSGNDYEKQKRFEEIANNDVKIDSLLNLPLNNQDMLTLISSDSIAIKTSNDLKAYLTQLLSFEKTNSGTPCSIDDDLKKMEIYINKFKSPFYTKLNEQPNKKLAKALKKYKNPC